MTTKNWTKIFESIDEVIFENKNNFKRLVIYQLHKMMGQVRRWIVTDKEFDRKPLKQVMTKSQALVYAKAYMRTH